MTKTLPQNDLIEMLRSLVRTVRQCLQTTVSVPFKVIVPKTNQLTCHSFTGDRYFQSDICDNAEFKCSNSSTLSRKGSASQSLSSITSYACVFCIKQEDLTNIILTFKDGVKIENRPLFETDTTHHVRARKATINHLPHKLCPKSSSVRTAVHNESHLTI